MKAFLLFASTLLIASTSFADLLQCATGMGNYDEVQKIQLYFEKDGIYIGSSSAAGDDRLGRCVKQEDSSLDCTFHTPGSLRPYKVHLELQKYEYTGTIDQAFRRTGYINCWLPGSPDGWN